MDDTQLINELLKLSHLTEDKKHLSKILFDAADRLSALNSAMNIHTLQVLQHAKIGDDSWAWMGDGEDHLESMSADMVVKITAHDLRELSSFGEQLAATRARCKGFNDIDRAIAIGGDDYDRAMSGV